jgi:hypothetical protein
MKGISEIFFRVLCVGSVLIYSASFSLIGSPRVEPSSNVISKVVRFKDGKASLYLPETIEEAFIYKKLVSRVFEVDTLLAHLGGFTQPPALIIDSDHPLRLSTSSTEIMVGDLALKAKGQFERSLIKAWLMQKGSSELIINPLRLEVTADILLATFKGKFEVEDPHLQKTARINTDVNWTDEVLETTELCKSPWRPLELASYCIGLEGEKVQSVSSPYALRSAIASLIWSQIENQSSLEKNRTLKLLARQAQIDWIVEENSAQKSKISLLKQKIETVALAIYPDAPKLEDKISAVALAKENKFYLLGGVEVNESEVSLTKLIVETCASPSTKDLLGQTSETTEHILVVEKCEAGQISYKEFSKRGVMGFALENPSAKFVYLHRPSLKLADKMIGNFSLANAIGFAPTSKSAKFLGLDQKSYQPEVRAFKVDGPIGAIEWFRAKIASVSGSRS